MVSRDSMFEGREEIEKGFHEVVETFRQKGAVSPDKAMTAEELSLPPRFEAAMRGASVVWVFLSKLTASTISQRKD